MFVPWGVRVTGTELDSHPVPTVHVNDDEVARWGSYGAWVTVMPKVANVSERIEGGSVKEPILPVLGNMSVTTVVDYGTNKPPDDAMEVLRVA